MKENTIAWNFEPHECVIFVQSTKIGTHENKAIHSNPYIDCDNAWVGENCLALRTAEQPLRNLPLKFVDSSAVWCSTLAAGSNGLKIVKSNYVCSTSS